MGIHVEQNYKIVRILHLLSNSEGIVKLEEICKDLKISKRVFYYNFDKLNNWLTANNFSKAILSEGFLVLKNVDYKKILAALEKSSRAGYILSKEERVYFIALCVGLSHAAPTIECLCSLLEVSRNTIIGETGKAKKYYSKYGILLQNHGKNGYRLSGQEDRIRYALMEVVFKLNIEPVNSWLVTMLSGWCDEWGGLLCPGNLLEEISAITRKAEKLSGGKFNQAGIQEAALYLMVIFIRSNIQTYSKPVYEISCSPEYKSAGYIVNSLAKIGMTITASEQNYIAMMLLGTKVFDYSEKLPDAELFRTLALDILQTYEAKAAVYFHQREQLTSYLNTHVRPMYYRLKYNIKVNHLLTREIMEKHGHIFYIARMVLDEVGQKYGFKGNNDEAAYLSAYFGAWIRKREEEQSGGVKKVLIVHDSGVGTSMLLKQELMGVLGTQTVFDILDARQVTGPLMNQYALVVTTVPLQIETDQMVLPVTPLLSQSQKKDLLLWRVQNDEVRMQGIKISDLVGIIQQHTSIQDERGLISDLARYLVGEDTAIANDGLRLPDTLHKSFIRIAQGEWTAHQAVEYACKAFSDAKLVDENYSAHIWDAMQPYNTCSIIAPGVLLAHGKPIPSAPVALSLTLFRKPVKMCNGREIQVIFTLVTPDNEKHFFAMQDLHRLLSNEEAHKRLICADFNSEEEVWEYILEILEDPK